jgi:MOSC domain-containing protein YiiM
MIVRALNVGAPVVREYQGRQVSTAFFKYPVAEPLHLGKLGFTGDSVVDDVHHGGPDKAALLYSAEHYPYWAQELGHDPGPAAMGENLTVEGLSEETVCIGDIYRIGGATVQISQPRVPCFKTNIRHGIADMQERVAACGFTGFYIRVLEEGPVQAGDAVTLVSRIAGAPTVARLNHVMHHDKQNVDAARALVDTEALAEVWRDYFRRRLG